MLNGPYWNGENLEEADRAPIWAPFEAAYMTRAGLAPAAIAASTDPELRRSVVPRPPSFVTFASAGVSTH